MEEILSLQPTGCELVLVEMYCMQAGPDPAHQRDPYGVDMRCACKALGGGGRQIRPQQWRRIQSVNAGCGQQP